MEKKSLTEEEANELFQKTFLQISKQNSVERQKLAINSLEHQKNIFDLSSKSPKKSAFKPTNYQNPQFLQNHFEISHDRSPLKIQRQTSHKLSIDKSQSMKEMHDFSLDIEIKSIEKEGSLSEKNPQILLISPKQNILSGELDQLNQEEQPQISITKQTNLYLESSIKQVKRDLQIKSKGKICKSQDINPKTGQLISYNFVCKNSNECPFYCSLQYSGQRTTKNQKLYKLVIRCQNHIQSCIEQQQEIIFMKLTKRVDDMQADIIKLLQQKAYLKPKQILSIMAQKIGQANHKFIYHGLANKNYHKAAKKYFDNLIYKIKNQMGIL